MYTLANADPETAISVLKSDIKKVRVYLKKVETLIQKQNPGFRSDDCAVAKSAEINENLKCSTSSQGKTNFELARLLNEIMTQVETSVYKSLRDAGKFNVSPSMSRLPVWMKLIDRLLPNSHESVKSSPKKTLEPIFAPLQNLL